MTTESGNSPAAVIAPPDAPKPAPPRPFIEEGVDYVLINDRVGNGLHHRIKKLESGSVEVSRLLNENIKITMSAADFEKFYKKL